MKLSDAKKVLKQAVQLGLINEVEAAERNTELSQIQHNRDEIALCIEDLVEAVREAKAC